MITDVHRPDPVVATDPSNANGDRSFRLGKFELLRDGSSPCAGRPRAPSARIRCRWMPSSAPACATSPGTSSDGWVNFDHVIGTRNDYGKVDFYAGTFNGTLKAAGVDDVEQFDADHIMATFKAILRDWVNEGFDPFAAPVETGNDGPKQGETSRPSNGRASPRSACRARPRLAIARRHAGEPCLRRRRPGRARDSRGAGTQGAAPCLQPVQVSSRSEVTGILPSRRCARHRSPARRWRSSSCRCSTDDWVEWLSSWRMKSGGTSATRPGAPWARVTMKAGDVAAMPADIRHQGYSTKRSMLYVWETSPPACRSAMKAASCRDIRWIEAARVPLLPTRRPAAAGISHWRNSTILPRDR